MNRLEVATLKSGMTFNSDLMLDKMFVLCIPPCPITDEMLKALNEWSFTQVESEASAPSPKLSPEETSERRQELAKKIEETNTDDVSDMFLDEDDDPQAKKIKEQIKKLESESPNQEDKIEHVRTIYGEYMNYINRIFMHYATHKVINIDKMNETVSDLCDFIIENMHFVLRYSMDEETYNKNVIVSHSIRSTVTAVTIGIQLKLSKEKLIELATACILHEIGQLRIPPQLYINNRQLSQSERQQLNTHPVLSFNILKECGFPLSIQVAALEHHELENGTGYPRKLTADKISLYAKIISVACSFEAVTSPRAYKNEQNALNAMNEMLSNKENKYNASVIKALLLSISTYPIGSLVYLSNGKIGRIIAANSSDPKNPVVQVTEADGQKTIIKTSDLTIRIMRPLSKKETEDYIAAQNK